MIEHEIGGMGKENHSWIIETIAHWTSNTWLSLNNVVVVGTKRKQASCPANAEIPTDGPLCVEAI